MQVLSQQPGSESDLAVLYGRRERLVSLIQSLERYQRCTASSHATVLSMATADFRLRRNCAK
jgi:hypothetical protein